VGSFERRSIVRGDFVISPNAPTFLAPGDETIVSVSVANNVVGSGKAAAVNLSVSPQGGLEIVDGNSRQLTIAELREGQTQFKVRARAPLGAATLTFSATLAGSGGGSTAPHSRLNSEISIRPAAPYLATFQAGHVRKNDVTVPVTRKLYAEHRTAQAGISYLPLGLTHGLRGYLEKYPHGCTEQITSQATPAIALGRHPEFGMTSDAAAASVERWVGALRTRQNEDGGFGRWAANPEVDKLASVWAAHLLIEARERGFAVPADLIKSTTKFLQSLAADDVLGLPESGVRAYATYVLTRGGMMTGPFVAAQEKHLEANHPKEWRRDIAGLYLAATYRLLKQDRFANSIVDAVSFGVDRTPTVETYGDRLSYDAQALYVMAKHFPERAGGITPQQIDSIVEPIFRGRYNTFSSAWAILALETYGQTAANAQAAASGADPLTGLTAREVANGGVAHALALPKTMLPLAAISQAAASIQFGARGDFGAYWVLSEAGFDTAVSETPDSHGIEVFRTYETADGKPATRVTLGEEVFAVVRVRALKGARVDQIALVDLLPGGFEPSVQKAAPTNAGEANRAGNSEANSEAATEQEGQSEGEGESGDHGGGESAEGDEGAGGDSDNTSAEHASGFSLSIALPGASFQPSFGDVREDRVVLYGDAQSEVRELRYALKATNVGTYVIPPIQASAMYDSTTYARGAGGHIVVVPRP